MPGTRRWALITGASGGLGGTIARSLVEAGHGVGLVARGADRLEDLAGALREDGGDARAFTADVLDPQALERAVGRFLEWAPRCDALVLAAGRLRGIGPMAAIDPDAWWLDLETSVRGAQLTIRAALPALKRSEAPSITVLVGPGSHTELAHGSGYAAGQAALVRLVECLAIELKPEQVPIFAVNPGIVPTALVHHLIDTPAGRRWLPRFNDAFAEGKEVRPEMTAELVQWLAEERPEALSGRVVSALLPPSLLATRLTRIEEEDMGKLRLR